MSPQFRTRVLPLDLCSQMILGRPLLHPVSHLIFMALYSLLWTSFIHRVWCLHIPTYLNTPTHSLLFHAVSHGCSHSPWGSVVTNPSESLPLCLDSHASIASTPASTILSHSLSESKTSPHPLSDSWAHSINQRVSRHDVIARPSYPLTVSAG